MKHLLTLCKSNKTLLRTKLYLDKLFIPKFLFLIDDRVNKWLSECSRVEMVENMCMDLVDFATIVTDIKLNRFYCDLPSSIRLLLNERIEDSRNDQATNKKRKSLLESSPSKIVTNDTVERDWKLKDGESWNLWRHKVGGAPILSCNSRPCLKYHVRGSCFSDCTNRPSHKKLTERDFQVTDKFIKQTRTKLE